MDESEAATETAVSHPFASRALLLAQLAEVIAVRLKDEPSKSRPSQSIAGSIGTSN